MSVVAPDKLRATETRARRPGESRDPVSFARYPKYKDSGVAWLGEVPAHWDVVPIKRLARLKGGAGFPHEEQGKLGEDLGFYKVAALANACPDGSLMPSEDTVSRETAGRLGAQVFPPETIVFAKVGAALLLGRVRKLATEGCIDNNMMGAVVSDPNDVSFLVHALSLVKFDLIANPGAVPSLNVEQIGSYQLPRPPANEQQAIATFLDRETGKIDALIAEQERLVALLKEKRQALISHTVTKGLDPNVPMKDSGIEWLGQVPAHWDVCQMRRALACKLTNGIFKRKEEFGDGTLLVNVFDAYRPDFKVDFAALDRVRCDVNEQGAYAVEDGDILFVRSSLKAEGVAVAVLVECPHENVVFECHLIRARLRVETALPRFASFLLSSSQYRDRLVSLAKITTMTTIEQESLASLPIVLPPVLEQVEIAAKLDREIGTFDMLAESAQHTIDLLKERRAALISAAVTGKICVLDS